MHLTVNVFLFRYLPLLRWQCHKHFKQKTTTKKRSSHALRSHETAAKFAYSPESLLQKQMLLSWTAGVLTQTNLEAKFQFLPTLFSLPRGVTDKRNSQNKTTLKKDAVFIKQQSGNCNSYQCSLKSLSSTLLPFVCVHPVNTTISLWSLFQFLT